MRAFPLEVLAGKVPHMAFVRLRVTEPFLSIFATADHRFFTIPVGSIIDTSDDLNEPGLHGVRFEGQELLAFPRDILERTEPVKEASGESTLPSPSPIRVYRTNTPV
jgi:hypothetical protein